MRKVREIMIEKVLSCKPTTDLANAAALMWEADCGSLPVVDDDNEVLGIVTDRDICIAVAAKARLASDIKVREVISGNIYSCFAEDSIKNALMIMSDARVRRLPVLDQDGKLAGIISTDDIVHFVFDETRSLESDITYKDLVTALQRISSHHFVKAEEVEEPIDDIELGTPGD